MVPIAISGPVWFIGIDAVLEAVSGVIALLIVLACFRYAKLAKDNRYAPLGWGFLLLFLGFIAQLTTSFAIWQRVKEGVLQNIVEITELAYVGHAAYVLLTISGLIVLALWALRIKEHLHVALVVALALFLAIIGITSQPVVLLLSVTLLAFVCLRFYMNACEQNTAGAWEVLVGFMLILGSQLALLLAPISNQWYVGGYVAHVIGYLVLLGVLAQVVRK